MHSLTAGVYQETMKIVLKKKTLFFLVATLLLPAVAAILLARFQSGIGIGAIASQDFPIIMLGLFTSIFFPLFAFMGAADLFSGEIGDRTMKLTLTRPITRFKVFASKQAALALSLAAFLAAGFAASLLSALWLDGMGGFGSLLDVCMAYAAAFLPLVTLSIAAVCLAQLFSSSSGALTASLLVYLVLKVAAFFVPQIGKYSPTAYTDWHMLWIGSTLSGSHIGGVFMFLAACSILFFTAGYYFFDKKEL
ncbi:ABC transporter permease [Paenibacillus hexagrammi]|uniref:ABC transporter permease subunit n=1 Tax=Paenibacillus hexagrammi TaxID=2908839 RepID=A0ABY3SLU0_9BACL|nr:ABC transporter permease subunit [Paenibacillus sp. YPD9-1]UJF34179.1 ABC transporter permease subunit [Paenibacillus sp. YPD9-1]